MAYSIGHSLPADLFPARYNLDLIKVIVYKHDVDMYAPSIVDLIVTFHQGEMKV